MDIETHRFSFEGSTTLLADHLTSEHGLSSNAVNRWRGGLTQGDWVALDQLHQGAHRVQPTRPAPQAGQRYELIRPGSAYKGIVIELTERFDRGDCIAWRYETISAPASLPKEFGSTPEGLLAHGAHVWRPLPPAEVLD